MIIRWIFVLGLSYLAHGQIYDCPEGWDTYYQGQKCYKMVVSPEATADQAVVECNQIASGAYVLAINTAQELAFISNLLLDKDPLRHTWLTSGLKDANSLTQYSWQGDNTALAFEMQQNWNDGGRNRPGDRIALMFNGANYRFSLVESNAPLSYICEISQRDAYKIMTTKRDFYYGVQPKDFDSIKYGPRFTLQPENVVMTSRTKFLFLECRAVAYPLPTYKWFRGEQFEEEILTSTDSRYTLTNGRLTIQNPTNSDENQYRCVAENQFGKIISSTATITYGYLSEISNQEKSEINVPEHEGTNIECKDINAKPSVVYNWQRQGRGERKPTFIFTANTPYIFISANGRLYFSEVSSADQAEYRCQVTLFGIEGNADGSSQPPSAITLPIKLQVEGQASKGDWGPMILNDFIAVFPSPPLVGNNVRFECFAYGTAVRYLEKWKYTWIKVNGFLPTDRVRFLDLNRVMMIDDIKPEDDGTYRCIVTRGASTAFKDYNLRLEAKPYFLLPLEDKHLDEGETMSWRCLAGGRPPPKYSWYKNGLPLASSSDITINGNLLTISSANINRHPGMYQCGAENAHGMTYSSAQIRVLSFKPNFFKNPLPESLAGALLGNITIPCEPEGAPKPIIKWRKNNVDMGLSPGGSANGRLQMLPNNFLQIQQLGLSDAGTYTCIAENSQGKSSSSCFLSVRTGTTIFSKPLPKTTVKENGTALINCQASADPALDLIYVWYFNGRMIDFKRERMYERVNAYNVHGLYIKMAQFTYAGMYTCVARTPLNSDSASGELEVTGRPGEPVGVRADPTTTTQSSVQLEWFEGNNHNFPVDYFIVECQLQTESKDDIWFFPGTKIIPAPASQISGPSTNPSMKVYTVEGLNPGNSYRFRLKAVNREGVGLPSFPSAYIQTKSAPPQFAPSNVTGGNGSVGDLTIRWDPLPEKLHGGPSLHYNVYYRMYKEGAVNRDEELWIMRKVNDWRSDQLVTEVGRDGEGRINYYRLYEVKIQAENIKGPGPNSSISFVYSAMGMPVAAPVKVQVQGYNSTALEVSWERVPNNRETMKGTVWGYQVNYWLREDTSKYPFKRSIRFYGDVDQGIVIGLQPDTYYLVDVQVMNGAGLGPLSDSYPGETSNEAPILYPEKLEVHSYKEGQVILQWRGVSTGTSEDTLKGYKIFVWQANENYRSAKEYETGKHPTEYILSGIEKNYVYAARVAAYSNGGDGSKSPTVYFTLYGGRILIDKTVTSLIQSAAVTTTMSLSTLLLTLSLCLLSHLGIIL